MSSNTLGLPTLLILASTYPRWRGDPEPGFVHELAKRLTGYFRVVVLCPSAPGALANECLDGVEVVRYRYAPQQWETLVNDGGIVTNLRRQPWKLLLVPGFVLVQAVRAWRISRRQRVDVLHAHWLVPQGLIAAMLQELPGNAAPFVVTSHGADLFALRTGLWPALKRFVIARAHFATVVSSAMRAAMVDLGADVSKLAVVSMGVDMTHRFVPGDQGTRNPAELLFVGRLVEKKGLRHLLDALPQILRKRPDVVLTIAGFGPQETQLKQQALALGVHQSVRFLGPVPQTALPDLYRRAALMVAPFVRARSGDQEGLGLVIVEALACGCPVLAGDVPAVHEVLSEMDNRFVIDPTDASRLGQRILELLDDEKGTRALVTQMRPALCERFDWERITSRYAALLRAAMARSG